MNLKTAHAKNYVWTKIKVCFCFQTENYVFAKIVYYGVIFDMRMSPLKFNKFKKLKMETTSAQNFSFAAYSAQALKEGQKLPYLLPKMICQNSPPTIRLKVQTNCI